MKSRALFSAVFFGMLLLLAVVLVLSFLTSRRTSLIFLGAFLLFAILLKALLFPESFWSGLRHGIRDRSVPLGEWARSSGWKYEHHLVSLPGELRRRTLERLTKRVEGMELVVEAPATFVRRLDTGISVRTWLDLRGFHHLVVLPRFPGSQAQERTRLLERLGGLVELESEAFRLAYTIEASLEDDEALIRQAFPPSVIREFERAAEREEALTFEYRQGLARVFRVSVARPEAVEALVRDALPIFVQLRKLAERHRSSRYLAPG